MGKITVKDMREIEGLKIIEPTVFGDESGYFMETYNYNDFEAAGIDWSSCRIISRVLKKVYCVDCTFRSIILRINWFVW